MEELEGFRDELHARVRVRASADSNFVHSAFAELCGELLEDAEEVFDFEPCFYPHQAENQVSRGREHIEQLKNRFPNVSDVKTDLTETFEAFKNSVPKSDDQAKISLSLANTRARLRMTSLYYLAGLHGFLVAGTGNKVEDFGVGFYTKYGDGGVDLSPIADLMKSDVYALGEFLTIPDSILTAAPTDGLFGDNRTDEDQLGASYDELEWAMLASEAGNTIADFTGREKIVFEIYKRLNSNNKHKMDAIPVCLIPQTLK